MQTIDNICNENIKGKILNRNRKLTKEFHQAEILQRKPASFSKTLGFMALLGLSALSISAMANNSEKTSQKAQAKTELTTQYASKEDSIIAVQQKIIEENNRKIAELQQKADKEKQIKEQKKTIRQQEQNIKADKINQSISDFYSKNKKSIWGSAIGLGFLLFHLIGRHKIYSMEKDCPDNFFDPAGTSNYPFVNKIYYRRSASKVKMTYAKTDNRNIFQKITDFLIDKGGHFTWNKGWTYTPFREPKPVDPIKKMPTWELDNKLSTIRMDIGASELANKQYIEDFGHDDWLITKNIKTLKEKEAKIEAELRSRGKI